MNVILFNVAWIWIRVPAPTPYTIIMWITAGTPVFPSIKKNSIFNFQFDLKRVRLQLELLKLF